jgi:alcohol dehydrogenase class IV
MEVVMHVPVEVAERARAVAAANDVDVLVCIGGGSRTGPAKAVALSSGLPRALRDLGLREDDLPRAVAAVLQVVPESNPTVVTTADLERLLHAAWEGKDPR